MIIRVRWRLWEVRALAHTHVQPATLKAEMSDMHEPECQDELEKSPSCQGRDGQKTVYPLIYLSPPFTRSLLHACYFLSVTSPQVCSFHKIKWSFCVACGNRLLETNQGPISHSCRTVIGAIGPSKWLHKSVLGVGWSLLLTSGLVSCLLLSGRGCWLDSLSLSCLMFSERWVNSFCCAASEHTSSVEHGDQPNLPCKGGALHKKKRKLIWTDLFWFMSEILCWDGRVLFCFLLWPRAVCVNIPERIDTNRANRRLQPLV